MNADREAVIPFLTRLRCWFSCEGVWPLAFMGTPLAKPCPRCGRVRFWT